MKLFKNDMLLLPEEKKYLLWVFLALFTVMLFQFLLYPRLVKIQVNHYLLQMHQRQIKAYEKRIADNMLQMQRNKQKVDPLLVQPKKKAIPLLNDQLINAMPATFHLQHLYIGTRLLAPGVNAYPIDLEFSGTPDDLLLFLTRLNAFSYPLELQGLKIDGLSPDRIFVTIKLTLQERTN
jgi:hypothetical protein